MAQNTIEFIVFVTHTISLLTIACESSSEFFIAYTLTNKYKIYVCNIIYFLFYSNSYVIAYNFGI